MVSSSNVEKSVSVKIEADPDVENLGAEKDKLSKLLEDYENKIRYLTDSSEKQLQRIKKINLELMKFRQSDNKNESLEMETS